MKQTVKTNLTRKLTVRFSPDEYRKMEASFRRTTKRKISEYVRSILLDKPITVYTRSQSLDIFLAEMVELKRELCAIGNNLNQSVKRLHTIDGIRDVKWWIQIQEKTLHELSDKMNEIHLKIAQIADQWLPE